MIDIHTHILPGVDDGAETLRDAVRLLRQAAEAGTKEIILTPHCAPSYDFFNYKDARMEDCFETLCRAADQEQIPVMLHPGMEVLYEGKKEWLCHKKEYVTLCGGSYILMEYYFDAQGEEVLEGIETVKENGYIPIIAHPERYDCVKEDWELAIEGRRRGALFQINKGSLSGRHGEKARICACRLLDLDIVDFVASDAHDPEYRGSRLDRVFHFISSEYGKKRARKLFLDNPRKVIHDSKLITMV